MKMVKSIGSKIDHKIKSGQINESELMKEAGDLMQQMKNMPGMKNMDKIFKSMNMPMGGAKMNFGAMQQKLNANMKKFNQKDRMLKKLQKRKDKRKQTTTSNANLQQAKTHQEIQAEIESIYKTFTTDGDKMQKSMKPNKKKKKNKNKKKKKKKQVEQ